ncbi:hypothetical protein [Litorilituus lipolyticus]|uniref:START domain-containing protein n=1 Tax=Litorilituus lipolyticus TaxID=2491017 RepID=A0A502KMJ8_9GAMM|nr:hypothetical protein [Litorilituus lipolyticus]TPH12920.1 hypothetical protein EPA86_16050 [Litorilituus lipolyticus]
MTLTWLDRKNGLFHFLIVIICLLYHQDAQSTNEAHKVLEKPQWRVWQKNSHIEVSYRNSHIYNSDNVPLLEVKATLQVDSSLSAFLLFIQDVENTPRWLINAKRSEITRQNSPQENQFYIEFKGLWPIKKRLLFIQSRYWQNKDLSVEIALTDAEDKIIEQLFPKERDDIIKVNIHQAQWLLTPSLRINEQTKEIHHLNIEYQFIADAGGNVPQWLAKHFALKSIWKSIRNIHRQLPESIWQQHDIPHIKELTPSN